MKLANRHIIVTGAASGMGRAVAELFLREGAQVAALDRDRDLLDKFARERGAIALPADLLDTAATAQAVEDGAQRMGGIDGIVNAAGIFSHAKVDKTDIATWQRVIGINLTGPYVVVQAALPWLRQAGRATIVNIASLQGLIPRPNGPAYHASKGGLVMLTRELAAELAPNIRANVVCPGVIDTPMSADMMKSPKLQTVLNDYAMGRVGTVDEVARAILFLTSDDSSYITGVTLPVDGGRSYH